MWTKTVVTVALASTLVMPGFSLLPAWAQPTNPGLGGRPSGMERLDLDLTPDQATKMQAIRAKYKDQMIQARMQLKQARTELRQFMANGAPESQTRAKFQQVRQLENQLAELRFQSMSEINAILTPAQRQQLNSRMEQRQQQWGNRQPKPEP